MAVAPVTNKVELKFDKKEDEFQIIGRLDPVLDNLVVFTPEYLSAIRHDKKQRERVKIRTGKNGDLIIFDKRIYLRITKEDSKTGTITAKVVYVE